MNWDKFEAHETRDEIREYVKDPEWQGVRLTMLGVSLQAKYIVLDTYLKGQGYTRASVVQVSNYVKALRRGGLLKRL